MSPADFIQLVGAPLQLVIVATVMSFLTTLLVRWIDHKGVTRARNVTAHAAASQAAEEAAATISVANIQDREVYEARLAARVTELENRNDKANAACEEKIEKMRLDMALDKDQTRKDMERDKADQAAVNAVAVALIQSAAADAVRNHAQQLADVLAENAAYKTKVSELTADNRTLWEQVNGLSDRVGIAGRALQPNTSVVPLLEDQDK